MVSSKHPLPATAPAPYGERPLPDGPVHPGSGRRINWRKLWAPFAAIGALVAKVGAELKGLLLLLPKLKILTTSGSMLVSVAAYSLIWGWKFAVGFVLLIFVHEMGHVLQLRREGVPASAPLFIPFLGAMVGMKQLPDDAAAEARVGLAGPVLGSIGALVPLAIWKLTGETFWEALAFVGFFLNLFNLLPVLPLDGGRAMAALTPWMWIVGYGLLIAATLVFPSPIMVLILLFGGMETYRRWQHRKTPQARAYHRVTRRQRVA